MSTDNSACNAVNAIATIHASRSGGASQAACAVIECMVAAATPMINALSGSLQERLLFSLVLAGTCATMQPAGENEFGVKIDFNPDTLRDAFDTFTRLTGGDIRPHLPKPMLDFAGRRTLN